MDKQRRRHRNLIVLLVVALVAGGVSAFAAWVGRPEVVRSFTATATWSRDGTATVHESIDYFFPSERHGIYRDIPGVPWNAIGSVRVAADHTSTYEVRPDVESLGAQMAARGVTEMDIDTDRMRGVRVRIGDPDRTVSGLHHYAVDYPLADTGLGGGRIGWNGVGTSWTVPVSQSHLEMLAPWEWNDPTCDTGAGGSVGGCTVSQPTPGRIVVTHGRLRAGEGITVYASAGRALAAAPAPGPIVAQRASAPPWARGRPLGAAVALGFLCAGLLSGHLLRRAGRDSVMAGPAGTGAATALAFDAPSMSGVPPGAVRVDDTRLSEWAGTEFAPPRGLTAWQGGIIAAEVAQSDHRVAWLLQAAADGYVDLAASGAGSVTMRRNDHPPDATLALLDVAFAGRDRIVLGSYDPMFAAMWTSIGAMQKRWLDTSVYIDQAAEHRVTRAIVFGLGATILGAVVGIAAAGMTGRLGIPAVIGCIVAAVGGGGGLAVALRSWELHVRTPAGSAMWLRIESFRRFLANSEAEHVQDAARRGVLREYSAWATALGEADHWNATVEAAGLSPDTGGGSSSFVITSHVASACVASSTSPSSSSGGGGGGGGGGTGGGGGGGGGGSW